MTNKYRNPHGRRGYGLWTERTQAELVALWPAASASTIARALGDGFTRNMVIGKANRMALCKSEEFVATRRGWTPHTRVAA